MGNFIINIILIFLILIAMFVAGQLMWNVFMGVYL
jgi:hypothetical protein